MNNSRSPTHCVMVVGHDSTDRVLGGEAYQTRYNL